MTYDPALDAARLRTLLARVHAALRLGGWWTLTRLVAQCGGRETGVSAKLRDLRKPRFGGHRVAARRVTGGQWEYHLDEGSTR